jgi:hypothetical protein
VEWFFHLTQIEQNYIRPTIIDHLKPKVILLITIGHEKGYVIGSVNVYHSSLSIEEYTYILEDSNMALITIIRCRM